MPDRGFREYHVTTVSRAPLRLALEWCTDYSPEHAKVVGEDRSFGLR